MKIGVKKYLENSNAYSLIKRRKHFEVLSNCLFIILSLFSTNYEQWKYSKDKRLQKNIQEEQSYNDNIIDNWLYHILFFVYFYL